MQTDGQTDGRTERPLQYRVLHYMESQGKNLNTSSVYMSFCNMMIFCSSLLQLHITDGNVT